MDELLAFSIERVSRLTGLSVRQLRYWDEEGVYSPEYADEDRRQPYSRVYSFQDVVALRTLAQLRKHVSLQQLRKLGEWLKQHYDKPWSRLRFYVAGRQVFVSDPDTGVLMTRPGQTTSRVFELEEIAQDTRKQIERLRTRDQEKVGRVVRRRNVMSNTPVIAGTRIPTAVIWDFHEAGYDTQAILREYPQLTFADVEAAISDELQRRKRAG